MRCIVALFLLVLSAPALALAQSTVFVVRHAERADAGMAAGSASDPELSAAGHTRATSLASMLKDARITAIFVTEFRRTRQTAEPLAKQLAIEPTVVSSNDLAALLARLKKTSGNALVVGHSNTVPAVLEGLGVQEAITIGEDYDNLFIVTRTPAASLVRLRYR